MGKVSDYISTLDGKEIDPIVVASTLLELHNEEMGIAEGKIAKLETDLTASTDLIAETNKTVTNLKAKNWDLVNRVPSDDGGNKKSEDPDPEEGSLREAGG